MLTPGLILAAVIQKFPDSLKWWLVQATGQGEEDVSAIEAGKAPCEGLIS